MVLISEFIYLYYIISVVHIFMDEFFMDDTELSSLTTYMADESLKLVWHPARCCGNFKQFYLKYISENIYSKST
jgi:hypothetical protein